MYFRLFLSSSLRLFDSLSLPLFDSLALPLFVFSAVLAARAAPRWCSPCQHWRLNPRGLVHVFPDGIFFVTTSGERFKVAIGASSFDVKVGSRQEGTLCEEADGLRGWSHVGFAAWCRYLLIIFHDVLIV